MRKRDKFRSRAKYHIPGDGIMSAAGNSTRHKSILPGWHSSSCNSSWTSYLKVPQKIPKCCSQPPAIFCWKLIQAQKIELKRRSRQNEQLGRCCDLRYIPKLNLPPNSERAIYRIFPWVPQSKHLSGGGNRQDFGICLHLDREDHVWLATWYPEEISPGGMSYRQFESMRGFPIPFNK